jgi:hypothetical protein
MSEQDQTRHYMQCFVVSLLADHGVYPAKIAQFYEDQHEELLAGFKRVILDRIKQQVKEED